MACRLQTMRRLIHSCLWLFLGALHSFSFSCFPSSVHSRSRQTLLLVRQTTTPFMTARDTTETIIGNSTIDSSFLDVPLSSTLCFSSDPVQDASRRAAFEKFHDTVSQHGGKLVPDSQAQEFSNTVHVNSIIFEVIGLNPILIILPNTDTVDIDKLQEYLKAGDDERDVSVRLAPSDMVEHVCGFPPGCVPMFGHSPTSLRTIVDEQLQSVDVLWGGGGHPEYSSLVATETLLNLNHVELADIVKRPDDTVNGEFTGELNGFTINGDSIITQQSRQKPFFPVAPPPVAVAEKHCRDKDIPIPLKPEPVIMVGRITGVRQMARRLVFADFAPANHPLDSNDQYPWKSGVDGGDMAVQLIAGKTLCQSLGDVAGPAALRRLKRGQLLLVKGKTNVGNRDSLRNWVEKTSLDVVVFSYQLLEEASTTPGCSIASCSKQCRAEAIATGSL